MLPYFDRLSLLVLRSFPSPCFLYTSLVFLSNSFVFLYLSLFPPLLFFPSSSPLLVLSWPCLPPPQVCLLPLSWPPAVPCEVGCSGPCWALIALFCLTLTQVLFSSPFSLPLPTSFPAPSLPSHFLSSMFPISHFPLLCHTPLHTHSFSPEPLFSKGQILIIIVLQCHSRSRPSSFISPHRDLLFV